MVTAVGLPLVSKVTLVTFVPAGSPPPLTVMPMATVPVTELKLTTLVVWLSEPEIAASL